jgi:hypothetical protein
MKILFYKIRMSCYLKKVFWNMLFDRLIISVVGIFLKKMFHFHSINNIFEFIAIFNIFKYILYIFIF